MVAQKMAVMPGSFRPGGERSTNDGTHLHDEKLDEAWRVFLSPDDDA